MKLGIITFLAEDGSHGYVLELTSMDEFQISKELYSEYRSKNSYWFKPSQKISSWELNQIVFFNLKSDKSGRKFCKILYTELKCLKAFVEGKNIIDYIPTSEKWYKSGKLISSDFFLDENNSFVNAKFIFGKVEGYFKPQLQVKNCSNEIKNNDSFFYWITSLKYLLYSINKQNQDEYWTLIMLINDYLKGFQDHRFDLSYSIEISCKELVNDESDCLIPISLPSFLLFWTSFRPELVKLEKILKSVNIDEKMRVELWVSNVGSFNQLNLSIEYFNNILVPELLAKNVEYQNSFLLKVKEIGKEELFLKPILEARLKNNSNQFDEIKKIRQFLSEHFPSQKNDILNFLTENYSIVEKLNLWDSGIVDVLPDYLAIRHDIEALPLQILKKILPNYSFEQQIDLLGVYTEKSGDVDLLSKTLRSSFLFALSEISFSIIDGEYDGYIFKELAWTEKGEIVDCNTEAKIKDRFDELKIKLCDEQYIFVGHNIIDFDIPTISKVYEIDSKAELLDTLLIETSLNPLRNSYALKTAHTAKEDVVLTRNLFVNQMFRLMLKGGRVFELTTSSFPLAVKRIIETWRNPILALSKEFVDFVNSESHSFFISNNALQQRANHVENKVLELVEQNKYIVVSPQQYWPLIAHFKNVLFLGGSDEFNSCVSTEKVNSIPESDEKNYLLAFLEDSLSNNRIPLLVNLPSRIRILVEKNYAKQFYTEQGNPNNTSNNICILPEEIEIYQDLIRKDNFKLLILDPELISITNKHFIGSIEHGVFESRFNKDSFWLYFTGGESRVQISKTDVDGFGFKEYNKALFNFWIQKDSFDKYSFWGSYDIIGWLNFNIEAERIKILNSNMLPASEGDCNIVFTKKNGKGGFNITRFNPETRYRDRYWLVQGEYIKSIISSNNRPAIVLIRNKKEIAGLRNYFLEENYFVPDPVSSTFRQIELLLSHERHFKVCFFSENQILEIINSGLINDFNIIIDSFDLEEKWFISQGTTYFEETQMNPSDASWKKNEFEEESGTDSDNEDEDTNEASKESSPKDIFLLLKLQKPIIDFYRWLINQTGSNTLWLLDSRLEDFTGLQDSWGAKIERFSLWNKEDDYKLAFKKIRIHLHSPQAFDEVEIDINAAIFALQEIFLKIKGEQHEWREEQIEYLTEILKRKDDLLISMPTGGGKSLLFQGPSLYRGSLSGRLTIVVTPLKALMEDQVDALWSRGLYGSVDYINSDRRNEIQYIYRRIAGGETLLLFITPERFRSKAFINALTLRIENDGGLEYAVYDEAHCVSQWGLDFRPDYLNSTKVMNLLKVTTESKFPVLLFSATASKQIINDFDKLFA